MNGKKVHFGEIQPPVPGATPHVHLNTLAKMHQDYSNPQRPADYDDATWNELRQEIIACRDALAWAIEVGKRG